MSDVSVEWKGRCMLAWRKEEGGRQAALAGDRKPEVKWRQLRCELKVFGSFGGSYRVAWAYRS